MNGNHPSTVSLLLSTHNTQKEKRNNFNIDVDIDVDVDVDMKGGIRGEKRKWVDERAEDERRESQREGEGKGKGDNYDGVCSSSSSSCAVCVSESIPTLQPNIDEEGSTDFINAANVVREYVCVYLCASVNICVFVCATNLCFFMFQNAVNNII